MTTGTEQSLFSEVLKANKDNYTKSILDSLLVDTSRKPYVLARLAIAKFRSPYQVLTEKALLMMSVFNAYGVVHPAFSVSHANEIRAYIVQNAHKLISAEDLGAIARLAMAVDGTIRLLACLCQC